MKNSSRYYRNIGKMICDRIELHYGEGFKNTLSPKVCRALVAESAFYIMQSNDEGSGRDLNEHGMDCYKAGLEACGLGDE